MSDLNLVKGYFPGALGRVVELHGRYYNENWDFGLYFESRVASDLAGFLTRYDNTRDGFWTVSLNGILEGSITIDGFDGETDGAHLRWFIVSDALRGTGLGNKLLNIAIEHCRKQNFPSVYLHTFEGLAAARHLYEQNGFQLVEQVSGVQWGTQVNEQRFLLVL